MASGVARHLAIAWRGLSASLRGHPVSVYLNHIGEREPLCLSESELSDLELAISKFIMRGFSGQASRGCVRVIERADPPGSAGWQPGQVPPGCRA